MQTIMCEMDEPQAPTVDQRELYSTSCEYMFNIRITESLHCKQKSAQHCKSTILKKKYIYMEKEGEKESERERRGRVWSPSLVPDLMGDTVRFYH